MISAGSLRTLLGRVAGRRDRQPAAGGELEPGDQALLDTVAERLRGVDAPAVAVLVAAGESRLAAAILARRPDAHVVTCVRADSHVTLAASGPLDLLLDESVEPAMRARAFAEGFLHVRPGGSYVVRRFRVDTEKDGDVVMPVARLVRRLLRGQRVRKLGGDVKLGPNECIALSGALGEVVFGRRHLYATNVTKAMPKIREEQVEDLLQRGKVAGRVLHRLPPAHVESTCVLRHNLPEERTLATAYDTPELALRAYEGVLCTPFQGVFQDDLILPDTYRHNQRKRLTNDDATIEVTKLFAVSRMDLSEAVDLPGTYFHFDNEHRGHFGHVMTEEMSRLWALERALESYPDLRVLVGRNYHRPELMGYERSMLDAFRADLPVTVITGPVRVERLISATPMLSHPQYVHPDITSIWRRVGRALERESTRHDLPTRVFCSRRGGNRECLNAAEVEDVFRDHGFTVLFPEDLSFADQVAMFRRADVVAGFAGSAMFTTCFVERPISVLTLTSHGYTATNEYMIASLLGHHLTMVSSPPIHPATEGKLDGFSLPFVVDFDDEGKFLLQALQALA